MKVSAPGPVSPDAAGSRSSSFKEQAWWPAFRPFPSALLPRQLISTCEKSHSGGILASQPALVESAEAAEL
jgi:hypothetical protein